MLLAVVVPASLRSARAAHTGGACGDDRAGLRMRRAPWPDHGGSAGCAQSCPHRPSARTRHANEDGYIYVLSGRLGAQVDEKTVEAGPGGVVLVPRGVKHTFWNPTATEAVALEFFAPAGLGPQEARFKPVSLSCCLLSLKLATAMPRSCRPRHELLHHYRRFGF
jgi:mannose-6-phosphate isomerase-like protein (cupin superfamily)